MTTQSITDLYEQIHQASVLVFEYTDNAYEICVLASANFQDSSLRASYLAEISKVNAAQRKLDTLNAEMRTLLTAAIVVHSSAPESSRPMVVPTSFTC